MPIFTTRNAHKVFFATKGTSDKPKQITMLREEGKLPGHTGRFEYFKLYT